MNKRLTITIVAIGSTIFLGAAISFLSEAAKINEHLSRSSTFEDFDMLGNAILEYTADYDDTFPPVQSKSQLERLFSNKCPNYIWTSESNIPSKLRYNTRLSNVKLSSIQSPSTTPILRYPYHRDPSKDLILIYVYNADGIHKELPPNQLKELNDSWDRLYPRISNNFYPPNTICPVR